MKINLVKFGQCDAGCCQWWHNLRCPPWRQCWLLPQILDMKLKCLKPHSNRPWVLCSPICFLWYVVDATWLQHIVFKNLEVELVFRFGGTQKCNMDGEGPNCWQPTTRRNYLPLFQLKSNVHHDNIHVFSQDSMCNSVFRLHITTCNC